MMRFHWFPGLVPLALLVGCQSQTPTWIDYTMGEEARVGPLKYTVLDTVWRGQLGEGFKIRAPQQRFFLITIAVTNTGSDNASIPLLSLENQSGQMFRELESSEGVENALGVLRDVGPGQTLKGRMLFDVGLASYKLRLSDGQPGSERYARVEIPLRLDADTGVQSLPGIPVR